MRAVAHMSVPCAPFTIQHVGLEHRRNTDVMPTRYRKAVLPLVNGAITC